PGDWFLALQGDRFDGHQFVSQAIALGAAGVIVQRAVAVEPQLWVPDTLVAYQAIARWWRQTLKTPLVAVTGSVGKTTTKELIAAALATQGGAVLKTQANYNNEIGVPKTLLALTAEHRYGVIEMGMRGLGQIALLTQIAQPNVAVITNVGTAHIELLGSEQAIATAKCELLTGLDPTTGIAVLNHDNERLMQTAAQVWTGQQITYGLEGGDVHGDLVDAQTMVVAGIPLPLPLPGRHNALNLLAAIAVMRSLGLDWQVLQAGLTVTLPSGRATRITLPQDIVLLDETYNAGVESMQAALQLLRETPGQRHIAVLGTMKELGEHSLRLHEQVGQVVQALKLDALMTLAEPAAAAALARGAAPVPVIAFDTPEALQAHLQAAVQPGDRILFKASRAVALDRVVDGFVQARTGAGASAR
ncbi:MAG TPA: UDP-N-acetylmuramoyl-tripeptide--D-alanyl-D-alanine ligase, partial [Candidatus Obscuribacterales bacterium]